MGKQLRSACIIFMATAAIFTSAGASASSYEVSGELQGAARGYLGCIQGRYQTFYACLAAYDTGDDVRAVIQVLSQTVSVGPLPAYNEMYVEDVHVPRTALQSIDKGPNDVVWLSLDIDFPRTGHLSLVAFSATGSFGHGYRGQVLCDQLTYAMSSSQVGTYAQEDGFVNGTEVVQAHRPCNAYWTAPADGRWIMKTITREGNLPK